MFSMVRAASAVSLIALSAMPALAQNANPVEAADTREGLADIVVTAQRKSENLQRVPISITALRSEDLERARVTDIRALSGLAPSVLVTAQGVSSVPVVTIRGIQSGVSVSAVDPKVGMYLDGVYIGRTVGSIFDIADLERIETLRGPQGTLFGRNATAGAISLITAPPTNDFGVTGAISYGNLDALRARATVNLGSLGPFSFKVTYLHDERKGDARNLLGGRTINLDQRDPGTGTLRYANRLGGKNTDAVLAAARFELDGFVADYRFDYTDTVTVGRAMQSTGPLNDTSGGIASGIAAFQDLTGGTINFRADGPLDTVANATGPQPLKVFGHTLTLGAGSGPFRVKSITGYRGFTQDLNIYDLAATGGQRFSLAQFGALLAGDVGSIGDPAIQPGPNDSFFNLLTARSARQRQFSQELQLIYSSSLLDFTGGVFYFHERGSENNILGIFQPVVNGVVIKTPLDDTFGSGVNQSVAVNDSFAIYGQATVHFTEALSLALGGRHTIDDRATHIIRASGAAATGPLGPGRYKKSFNESTYAAILSYQPNSDLNTYAKIASGYVAGGIAFGSPYEPEKLTSYEVGVKLQAFDRRLRVNAAAFYSDYTGLQVQQFLNGVNVFVNAGSARIAGGEIEIEAVPTQGLNLSASLGYADFKYREFILSGVDVADIARPLYAPKVTARLSGEYRLPNVSAIGEPFARLDARYRSRAFLTVTPTGFPATDATTISEAHWIIDGRLGLANVMIGGAEMEIAAWGQNLLDKRVYTFGPPVFNQVVSYDIGRTYGLELKVSF